MRRFGRASVSSTTVVAVAALYGAVVAVTALLSTRVPVVPIALNPQTVRILAAAAALFSGLLLFAIGLGVVALVNERKSQKPGGAFKTRLTVFFVTVVVASAVPQALVSVAFLSSGLQVLFDTNTGDALRGGLDIALDYYDDSINALRSVSTDGTLQRAVDAATDDDVLDAVWDTVSTRFDRLGGVALRVPPGRWEYRGAEVLRQEPNISVPQTARVERRVLADQDVLQLIGPITIGTRPAVAVVTVRLPERYDEAGRSLTRALELFADLERLRPAFVRVVTLTYAVFASPIVLLALFGGFLLSDRLMRPIEALNDATRRVAAGDYSVRILTRAGEDLGPLVASFNRMVTDLDAAQKRVAQTEKLHAWREIAQRLAHEVKNPLTPIRLTAERLVRRWEAGDPNFESVLIRAAQTITTEVDALAALLNEFRSLSRLPEPRFEIVQLRDTLEEVARGYRSKPEVHIDVHGVAPEITIVGDRGQIRQVFGNLLSNAVEAGGSGVSVHVHATVVSRTSGSFARVRVADDGPGIPEKLRDSLFQPYVTGKDHGTGLGLAIVERIVFDHRGRIWFESDATGGTTFVLEFPVAGEEGAAG